ncbi:MAG: hypothetical protein M9965_15640 [Anaerolineae bacterium]|nr:hypothetical protein [Anaerolineae bacterium]
MLTSAGSKKTFRPKTLQHDPAFRPNYSGIELTVAARDIVFSGVGDLPR